jgi:hypothetical protein
MHNVLSLSCIFSASSKSLFSSKTGWARALTACNPVSSRTGYGVLQCVL